METESEQNLKRKKFIQTSTVWICCVTLLVYDYKSTKQSTIACLVNRLSRKFNKIKSKSSWLVIGAPWSANRWHVTHEVFVFFLGNEFPKKHKKHKWILWSELDFMPLIVVDVLLPFCFSVWKFTIESADRPVRVVLAIHRWKESRTWTKFCQKIPSCRLLWHGWKINKYISVINSSIIFCYFSTTFLLQFKNRTFSPFIWYTRA